MTRAVAAVPASLPIRTAARLGRRRRARLLVSRLGAAWTAVAPEILEEALRLGLEHVGIRAVLWDAVLIAPDTPEVIVRRMLSPARPFVLVAGRRGPIGAVVREAELEVGLPLAVPEALGRLPDRVAGLLRRAGMLADEAGWAVGAVGGVVRDLLRGDDVSSAKDLDLVVEGDGLAFADRLAADLGGAMHAYPTFLTATVELADGRRVDVATARRERYAAPGALPRVEPASLAADLTRRDVSVNALAIRLNASAWGEVVDPTGGLVDLRARRIRVLHPLSFIEDPTRILRAARFAVRLGCRLETTTRRLLRAAAALPVYKALSPDRLHAEIEATLAEPDPATVFARLGRLGALRLLDPSYRFSQDAARRLEAVARSAAELPLTVETREGLFLLALTAHLAPGATNGWGARLGAPASLRAEIGRARDSAPDLLGRLQKARGPGEAYAMLRSTSELAAAWAHACAGRSRARRHVATYLGEWREARPLMTGHDLQALGLSPGPMLGQLLGELRSAQVAGRIRDRGEAVEWAREAIRRLADHGPTDVTKHNPTG